MIQVSILGFGNVGQHLFNAFQTIEAVEVVQVYNRSEIQQSLENIDITYNLNNLKEADVYLVALPDDEIPSFTAQLPFSKRLVVHTSGNQHITGIDSQHRRGVFYPLQTFSKNRKIDFSEIPICVEAENVTDLELLKKLGNVISKKVIEISSETRSKLHLAAVFANNFSNYMVAISEGILKDSNLPFDILKPLIHETAAKLNDLSPSEAQTGPAVRHDIETIEKHLHLLKEMGKENEILLYRKISEAIQKHYGKEL